MQIDIVLDKPQVRKLEVKVEPKPLPAPEHDGNCPRCVIGIVFVLGSGTQFCLNCGELEGDL